ncbi:MAG: hypothetical protein ACLGIN_04255 [Candidatus Sericytochromatia bacterium]
MRAKSAWIITAALCFGCVAMPTTSTAPGEKAPSASRKVKPGLQPALTEPGPATGAAPESVLRAIAQTGTATQLIGKVKLISDKGIGVISNNSGGLVSNNGGGLVSNNGGGLVSNNGAGVISGNGGSYRVQAAAEEALLAEALIEVIDAQGRVLTDEAGAPLTATTDQAGQYRFKAVLPQENLVLRVRLFPHAEESGGELVAILPRSETAEATIDLDTASSLGTRYVLDRYVKRRQELLDRLPASEVAALRRDMESARAHLTAAPSYRPEDLVARAEELRTKAPALDTTLERIEAILLAGQQNLGTGLQATQISLGTPLSVLGDAEGNLYIGEATAARIRKVAKDGTVSVHAGKGSSLSASTQGAALSGINNMVFGPDGTLYVSEAFSNRVQKIGADGRITPVAGNSLRESGAVGGPATQSPLVVPAGLALGPDGTVYLGELPDVAGFENHTGRLLYVDAAGNLQQVPTPGAEWQRGTIVGLQVAADGTIYALNARTNLVARKPPGGGWEILSNNALRIGAYSRALLAPDGSLYVSESDGQRVVKFGPDGQMAHVAGTGRPGFSGDGGPATQAQLSTPSGMWLAPDGTLYLADSGNGLIRAIDKAGVIRTVAGSQGLKQQGDALTLPINQPAGVTVDAEGRIVFNEIGSYTIKRLEGQQLTTLAGTTRGFSGDGGPAIDAAFDVFGGLAYHGETLYVVDSQNNRLRRITADGRIDTIAGSGGEAWSKQASQPALSASLAPPMGLAIAPDGQPHFTDMFGNVVLRLTPEGQLVVVAGDFNGAEGDSGDGGPAVLAKLNKPTGLAFDAEGNLLIADAGNFRIRKVAKDGTITTVAGLPTMQALAKVVAGGQETEGGAADQAVLVAPSTMAFDAAGNMYVAEIGTFGLSMFQGAGSIPIASLPDVPARIRKVTPDGKIYTVAGVGGKLLADPDSDNMLTLPIGIAIDAQGRLIIADSGSNQIKVLPKSSL